jgi:beta-N-acetylhexosaminidase
MSDHYHPLGHHLIVGLHGTTLSESDRTILKSLRPAGLIFFARNFEHGLPYKRWLARFQDLLTECKELIQRDRLLLSIDHEGGHICRIPGPITKFPYAVQYRGHAQDVGRAAARELASLGLNVSWAPVVDVNSNPENPVIGIRSFGDVPQDVSTYACAYLRGLEQGGVYGCAKHFPGHGDTSVDSHFGLPVQLQSLNQIRSRELPPFKATIDAGVQLIMTAHVLFSQIDSEETVTLSPKFLTNVLRGELGYQGVIVSDDLEMAAVRERFLEPGTLGKAFAAGNDMLIIARSPNLATDVAQRMWEEFDRAWDAGEIREESLLASRTRVQELLDSLPQHSVAELEPEVFRSHAELALVSVGAI